MRFSVALLTIVLSPAAAGLADAPQELPDELARSEAERVAVAARIARSTIAIFESTATNGGSGVIIDSDGYAVTNYHVVSPCGAGMTCGLSDGRVREAVLVGLDPTGDIALVRLLGEGPFPAADTGDSDLVRVGDEAFVSGNPFMLADDFTPTITRGILSGVRRYQEPSGTLLEYADCLQTDAAINPGNSGGPLFDGAGRLIGINGRGSFEKRGRVNVGVGYAVSINQVKRFLSQLRCGRLVDHAALGATVITRPGPIAIVDAIETDSDAYRRGLRPGDEIVALGDRDITSANDLLNAVGRSPAGWRERLVYRRGDDLREVEVRLGELHSPGELAEAIRQPPPRDPPPEGAPTGWRSHHRLSEDFANLHFNRLATERLIARLPAPFLQGELSDEVTGDTVRISPLGEGLEWLSDRGRFVFDPTRDASEQLAPPGAPGLLATLWVWRALHDSRERADDAPPVDRLHAWGATPWRAGEEPAEVLVAEHGALRVEFYFETESGSLIGVDIMLDEGADPTRLELGSDLASRRAVVRVGDRIDCELRTRPASEGGS